MSLLLRAILVAGLVFKVAVKKKRLRRLKRLLPQRLRQKQARQRVAMSHLRTNVYLVSRWMRLHWKRK